MITYDLNLCIGKEDPDKKLTVKCHDTGVNIRVHLMVCRPGKWQDEYVQYTIPAGSTAVLNITKPDKKYCITDGEAKSTEILFEMVPQAFTVAGISKAEVSLYSPDGKRITSSTFHIDVPEECICGCDLESENYIDVMSEQIRTAIDAANRAEAAAVHGPIIQDGSWWLWNPDAMRYEDSGVEVNNASAPSKQVEENRIAIERLGTDKLDASALPEAVNAALATAKESGVFDGPPGPVGPAGADGKDGAQGEPGMNGKNGSDGKDGQPGADGKDGSPGKDGVSPTVAVSKSGKVTTVTITDANGTKTATINDGEDGSPGKDGNGGVHVGDDEPTDDTVQVWIPPSGGSLAIVSPETAQVGQTIVVKSVDENGKPTAWEAADFPKSKPSYVWEIEPTTDEVSEITYNLGNSLELGDQLVNADTVVLDIHLKVPAADSTDSTKKGVVNAGIYIPWLAAWAWRPFFSVEACPVPAISSPTTDLKAVAIHCGKEKEVIDAGAGWLKRDGLQMTTISPKNQSIINGSAQISGIAVYKVSGTSLRDLELKVTSSTPIGAGSYVRLEVY